MKKILIDIQSTKGRVSGLGVYTKNVTDAMIQIKPPHYEFAFASDHSQKLSWNTLDRLFWENWKLPQKIRAERSELLHIPAFACPMMSKSCKIVMTVHDLIGMIFPNQKGIASKLYWGRFLPASARRANHIIADSVHTKKDIVEHLRIPEEKISVVYPSGHEGYSVKNSSADRGYLSKAFGLKTRYFLFVGTLEPRKNLKAVIAAFLRFRSLAKVFESFRLVVIGSKEFAHGREFKELSAQAKDASDAIMFTGYLPQEDLNRFYSNAEGLLFPSLYEGFGIPVLEAMASGTPVVTSTTSSLPEVAGDSALLINPYNTDEIILAMKQLAEAPSLRQDLIAKGFQQIKKFSWTKTAEQTIAVYDEVLK